jgi:RNA polymerase sigma-70 factor, ECF subfamily
LSEALDQVVREAGARIRAALAARFRSLDLAEDAFAEACARAAEHWATPGGVPLDPAAWLYRVATRAALDQLRRAEVRGRLAPGKPEPQPTPEELMLDDSWTIPDERLRLIFVCCHPAIAPDARAALTLRTVCGLGTAEIARAFLLPEPTLAQRMVRAKRKISEAGVPFEVPGPELWRERIEAVLTTVEIAYSKAHEDASGAGPHAGYAPEMLALTGTLAELIPDDADVLALAATVRFAEARRPGRVDADGLMVQLSEQDPSLWDEELIQAGRCFLARVPGRPSWRVLQARLHAAWCDRASRSAPPPWPQILSLYDAMLEMRDDPVIRTNRAVALAEVHGAAAGLAELDRLDHPGLGQFPSYLAARADMLRRAGRKSEAHKAYDALLGLGLPDAERRWLERRRAL